MCTPHHTVGTKIQFASRAPASKELLHCPHIQLTSEIDWNPTQVSLSALSLSQKNLTEDSMDDCPRMVLLSSLRRVNSQVSRSECDSALEDIPSRQSCTSRDGHSEVSAEALADGFAIGIGRAGATPKATHQKGTGSAILPPSRRHRADRQHLGKRLNAGFSTNTLCFKKRSLTGNVGCQIFGHESGFDAVHHIPKSNDECVGNALKDFVSDCGAPEHPTVDGAAAQVGRNATFQKLL